MIFNEVFFETSKYHSFKKATYITLRWIGIIGQLIAVNFVYFILGFEFDFFTSNFVIFLGILSNLYLIFVYKKTQLSVIITILSYLRFSILKSLDPVPRAFIKVTISFDDIIFAKALVD